MKTSDRFSSSSYPCDLLNTIAQKESDRQELVKLWRRSSVANLEETSVEQLCVVSCCLLKSLGRIGSLKWRRLHRKNIKWNWREENEHVKVLCNHRMNWDIEWRRDRHCHEIFFEQSSFNLSTFVSNERQIGVKPVLFDAIVYQNCLMFLGGNSRTQKQTNVRNERKIFCLVFLVIIFLPSTFFLIVSRAAPGRFGMKWKRNFSIDPLRGCWKKCQLSIQQVVVW